LEIRNIATVVSSVDKKPKFYGKELRKIRGIISTLEGNWAS